MSEVHASAEMIEAAMAAGEASVTGAPESHAEAPEVSGVVDGTEVDYKAAYDALMVQFDGYRQHMLTVADRYTKRHGWCREVKNAIAEIDPVAKMPTNDATGEITVTMRVEITDQEKPVTPTQVWSAFASLVNEVAYRGGDPKRVRAEQYGTLIGAESLVITHTGGGGLRPYVSPDQWRAEEEKRESERRVSRMQSRYYGTCGDCESNLDWNHHCKNVDCEEYVSDDND